MPSRTVHSYGIFALWAVLERLNDINQKGRAICRDVRNHFVDLKRKHLQTSGWDCPGCDDLKTFSYNSSGKVLIRGVRLGCRVCPVIREGLVAFVSLPRESYVHMAVVEGASLLITVNNERMFEFYTQPCKCLLAQVQ